MLISEFLFCGELIIDPFFNEFRTKVVDPSEYYRKVFTGKRLWIVRRDDDGNLSSATETEAKNLSSWRDAKDDYCLIVRQPCDSPVVGTI